MRRAGVFTHAGPLAFDREGKASGGVVFVSDWPVEMVAVPVTESFDTRVMAVKARRPHQRPLLIINGYLPANDAELNQHIASTVLRWAVTTGEDFVFLADWNRTPHQQPLCNLVAGGAVYAMDPDPFAEGKGTHRLEDGIYTGRLLDFGLSSAHLAVSGRAQLLGPADHDLVTYDVHLHSGLRGWRWQAQQRLALDKETVDWQLRPGERLFSGGPWERQTLRRPGACFQKPLRHPWVMRLLLLPSLTAHLAGPTLQRLTSARLPPCRPSVRGSFAGPLAVLLLLWRVATGQARPS